MATYQPRGHANGSSSSFGSSSINSQSTKFTPTSSSSNFSSDGLFPTPLNHNRPAASQAPGDYPRPSDNIINRRAGADTSLYQICVNLKKRLADVPGFQEHIQEMNEEEAEDGDYMDPVTAMWNCLRRGFPLITVYNALRQGEPLRVDSARFAESKIGKAATFQFLHGCLSELKFPSNEAFLITDLYGEDTTGFVKVTKCVNKVLDILQQRGLLLECSQPKSSLDDGVPQSMTIRQKIVEEFVKTERDYVNHLETLQQFKNQVEESGAIPGDTAHDIFLNLNALLDFQRRFLIRIEQQNSLAEAQQDWGKLIHHYKESFRVYEPFIANQTRCQQAVERQWDKLKKAPLSPDLRDLVEAPATLSGFLLKPFQRLTKYPLLLQEMHDKGGLDEARRRTLQDGIGAAKAILARANEAIHKEEKSSTIADLLNRVEDWKGHKIDHFGELLVHGPYTVVKGEGPKEVEREVSRLPHSLDSMSGPPLDPISSSTDCNQDESWATTISGGRTTDMPCLSSGIRPSGLVLKSPLQSPPPSREPRRSPKILDFRRERPVKLDLADFWDVSSKNVQYKVYLFEHILLCCKEINLNKPKNKMLGNSKPLVDKKGQPKLQLKGRIFMQNVTDVLTFARTEKQSYTVQIFWKGDPGVENFVIRFPDEKTMKQWQELVQKQKEALSERARKSGQNGPSSTSFKWLDDHKPENPYREADDEDDDQSSQTTLVARSGMSSSRNASSNSLRSMGTQHGNHRMPPTRYPGTDVGHAPPLSLNTNVAQSVTSPGEFAGQSYFSPSVDSPNSTRSSSQASMYAFSRQQGPPPGWSYENGKHRTAPAMSRAPSRDGLPASTRPSLPAMGASQYTQQQLSQAQNRLRSASTPDINGPGQRRQPNGQTPQDHVPVPPIPPGMRVPINRSQTASPLDALPMRGATQSPAVQQQLYDNQGQRKRWQDNEYLGPPMPEVTRPMQPSQITSHPSDLSDREALYPPQLKVKILFDPPPSHVTIVVPITIRFHTLVDRIDSKMGKVNTSSITKGSARLRYRDRDDDLIIIHGDEDVADAIEEWGVIHEGKLRQGVTEDFELFWQEKNH